MSLRSFFNGIFAAIASLFHGLVPELKKAIDIAYQVTNSIKSFDSSMPLVGDLLSHLLPSHLGEEVINILRLKLPEIVVKLRLVDVTLGLIDPNEIMQVAIKAISAMDGQTKNVFLNSLSIMIAQEAADGHLAWDVAAYTGKWYFDHNGSLADVTPTEPIAAPVAEVSTPVEETAPVAVVAEPVVPSEPNTAPLTDPAPEEPAQ